MRAYLHLVPRNEEISGLWQILEEDYDLKKGEVFHYTKDFYNKLDDENKALFKERGLELGEYEVVNVEVEHNGYWGDIRILTIILK